MSNSHGKAAFRASSTCDMSDNMLSRTLIEKSLLSIGNLHKTVPVGGGPGQSCIKRVKIASK